MQSKREAKKRIAVRAWMALLAIGIILSPPLAGRASAASAASDEAQDARPASASVGAPQAAQTALSNVSSSLADEIRKLRESVQAQEQALAEHSQAIESERELLRVNLDQIARLEEALHIAPEGPAPAEPDARAPATASGVHFPQQGTRPQRGMNDIQMDHPRSFKIGAADFTPGGFVDLTGIFRSTNTGVGLGTNFSSMPFNNTLPQARLSEFRFTSQASRLSLKVEAKISESTAVTGYVESDFNGYLPPNALQSTNADSLRLRLYYLDIRHGKWEVVGGQTWSLLTSNRAGISPEPVDVFTTLRLDTNYVAGLVYARQPGVRVIYHSRDWWTLGASLENPQQFVPNSLVFPGPAGYFAGQFDNGSGSTSSASSVTNTLTPNLHPDIVVKSAWEWKLDERTIHLEIAGLLRTFRVYQNIQSPNSTNSTTGGGFAANADLQLFRGFHLLANSFYGDGVGRYIGGLGPDVVVKANGTLSGIHAGSGLAGFEWQVTPGFLLDGYYSGAYFQRNYGLLTSTASPLPSCDRISGYTCVGFGFPGSANTNNRAYQQGTIGFIRTLWSNSDYGKLQIINQYSYVVRSPWSVPEVGTPPQPGPKNAHVILGYVALRYIIP